MWNNADGLRHPLDDYAPAIGQMAVDASMGRRHLGLPSDLYLMTAYCDEGLLCGEAGEGSGLEVMVTSFRTRPGLFQSLGCGQLALCLLTPLGAMHVLRAPLDGLTDRRIPLEHFCGRGEQRRLRSLLMASRAGADRIEAFGRWIESRIRERRVLSLAEGRVARATRLMQRPTSAAPGVGELSSALGVTERQLQRDFRQWLGVSPAAYGRLVRFQRAAAAMASGVSIAHAAADGGFADQAHLTRVVRELTSITPGQLRLDTAKPGRAVVRSALAGRVLMADVPQIDIGAPSASAVPRCMEEACAEAA